MKSYKKLHLGIILGILGLFLAFTLWPVKGFLHPRFVFGKTLVIFTNEAEARPCGGFVSAYGEVRGLWPKMALHNVYTLSEHALGPAPQPLDRIASQQFFWDLGTSSDLKTCAEDFEKQYKKITEKNISQTVLVDLKMLDQVLAILGPVKLEDEIFTHKNAFARLTREVANTDRHNEEALATRKVSVAKLGKKIMTKALMRPDKWPVLTRLVAQKIKHQDLYEARISDEYGPTDTDFSLTEWNLGGGKSSRYLDKTLQLTLRETEPQLWKLKLKLVARHLGAFDEPLSQNWKGMLEVTVPKALAEESIFIEGELAPGEILTREWDYHFRGAFNFLTFFSPRGQHYQKDIAITLFPQNVFETANFQTRENTGQFRGDDVKKLEWSVMPDQTAPFITLHEIIAGENLKVEVHFNESVKIHPEFTAKLTDLQHEISAIAEDPVYQSIQLLSDQRTLLLTFTQREYQPEERFALEIAGVEDLFGNTLETVPRTVIDRR